MTPRNGLPVQYEIVDLLSLEAQARAMRAATVRAGVRAFLRAISARLRSRRAPVDAHTA